ncbi:UBX domain-containing protein 4 [Cryptotermes secundus]|uniref:UBX domain-containing protein 4 n=1 Tax=Cryptotermes secundus TaxID=105785 RepID=A0A2J7Q2U4_9NEOP|nr:UBX domain-containing protein 4 [Cryptotermes secundus]PNF22904.1 UBX domain-containing protein 4 [Cryptotermes secundus]PNF22905.1 UBX domain-containing protein 4 [Cryptotermes secundus]
MRWFQGGIAEAVAASKTRNAVFVVFVEGKDDLSKSIAATIDNTAVSSKLESEDFVVIRLDSGSEAYRQFAQIYHLVPVPSLFFIGGNGVPLEVVAGEVNEPELLRRITLVLEKSGKAVSPEDKAAVAETQETKQDSPKATPHETGSFIVGASSSKEEATEVKNMNEDQIQVAANAVTGLTPEEKIERAKELIEKKRKQKEEEEEQTQQQKEIERRKVGQEVQKLRRWQQDQELKQLKEERQKEKAEEAAARERILKQIAQDRAERALRSTAEQEAARKQAEGELRRQSEQCARDVAAHCDMARIQFRLPDGSSHSHNFGVTTTLGEVRSYVATQLSFPFREFIMSTTFPRREFTAADDCQTVSDAHLVPSAVILILPASSGTVVTSSRGYSWAISQMVWSLLTPLVSILSYLRNWVFGSGGRGASLGGGNSSSSNNRGRNTQQSSPPNPASTQNPTGARRRTPTAETTAIRREGNIHRLTNRNDPDDDENNTWNGNSTQQM